MKLRFKNYGLWVALGSLVTMIITDSFDIAPEQTQAYINVILGILTAAGVVSNPEKGKWFHDGDENEGGR